MDKDVIGSVIALDCGTEGYFQGRLVKLDMESEPKVAVLTNVFQNGESLGREQKQFPIDKINFLKILRKAEAPEPPKPVEPTKPPKPVEPTKPPKPAEPTKPLKPVEPTKPTKKVAPNKNRDSFKQPAGVPKSVVEQKAAPVDIKPKKVVAQIKPQKWVSRPLKNSELTTSAQEFSSSSDIDSRQQIRTDDSQLDSVENETNFSSVETSELQKVVKKPRARGSKKKDELSDTVVESTPTPLFKRYEPQVPQPQSLKAPAWAVKSTKKGLGPCGIPILDVQNGYGPISRRDVHLDNPIDFEELAEDFDFAKNLKLFDKEKVASDDEDFYETFEKSKMSQNFKHDENIISDPQRITSWTKITSKNCFKADEQTDTATITPSTSEETPIFMSFCPSSFELLPNGQRIPVIAESIKPKYINSCIARLSVKNYSAVVADRMLMYFNEILYKEKQEKPVNIAVIGNKDIGIELISRLSGRGHNVVLISDIICKGNVPVSKDIFNNIGYIFILDKTVMTSPILKRLNNHPEIHIFALDFQPTLSNFSKTHILMLGVATAGLRNATTSNNLTVGKTTFEALCKVHAKVVEIDCRIADIGVPFDWIVDGGKEALSSAFFNSVLIRF